MTSSYEKSVKGATKQKLAAPKSKYVEHILQATNAGEAGVAEIFRTMHNRLRDSTWTIVFKGLIITHLMIKEGQPKITLKYLAESPSKMAISTFSDVQLQGENIRKYHKYLLSRVKAYATTEVDWVLNGKGRLQKQTVDKGLLRETEAVQSQISALIQCDLFAKEMENEITLTALRLLTMDILALYEVSNEGAMNVLEHYFEMSKPDAERALRIYRTFASQTDQVVAFLSVARQHEITTRLAIQKLKHAPTSLAGSLEEYLNDPDFEINRRQYLAQKEAKRTGKTAKQSDPSKEFSKMSINGSSSKTQPSSSTAVPSSSQPQPQARPAGPAPDLIDFFESIEQNQQPMMLNSPQGASGPGLQQYPYQQQQPGFVGQQMTYGSTNPFASMTITPQLQNQGQVFGIPQNNMGAVQAQPFGNTQSPFATGQQPFVTQPTQQQPQPQLQQHFGNTAQTFFDTTQQDQQIFNQAPVQSNTTGINPFRVNSIPQQSTPGTSMFSSPTQSATPPQSTNPFRSSTMPAALTGATPFGSSPPPSSTQSFFSGIQSPQPAQSFSPTQPNQSLQPLQPTKTGTNPFKSAPPSAYHTPLTSPLAPQQTGTNPFRQSAFVNQQTGQGWQANQGTMGGLEQLSSIPVFPRPTTQAQQPWP